MPAPSTRAAPAPPTRAAPATLTRAMPPILRPLGGRAFAALWTGLATSSVGDQLFTVVLSWVAVGVLGTAAGYLAALQAAVVLVVALTAGRWADRRDDRRVMLAADLARAAMLVVVVMAWLAGDRPAAWSLVLCVVVLASGQALFRPALQATLPTLVDDIGLLPAANALIDTTERIARLLGPGLIGLASALLPLVHFVTFDALTFIASAAAILAVMRLRPAAAAGEGRRDETVLASLKRGFRAASRHPVLGFLLFTTAVINGAWYAAYFVGVPLLIAQHGVTGPGGAGLAAFGLIISAYGSTNLATTLIIGGRGIARHPARLIFGGNVIGGLGIIAMGAAAWLLPDAWLLAAFALCAAFGAIAGPLQDVTVAVLRQTELPRADLAAAIRAYMVMANLGLLVALLLAPTVFDTIGVTGTVAASGGAILLVGIAGLRRFAEHETGGHETAGHETGGHETGGQ